MGRTGRHQNWKGEAGMWTILFKNVNSLIFLLVPIILFTNNRPLKDGKNGVKVIQNCLAISKIYLLRSAYIEYSLL